MTHSSIFLNMPPPSSNNKIIKLKEHTTLQSTTLNNNNNNNIQSTFHDISSPYIKIVEQYTSKSDETLSTTASSLDQISSMDESLLLELTPNSSSDCINSSSLLSSLLFNNTCKSFNSILQLILCFLQPHECVALTSLNLHFHDLFWLQSSFILNYDSCELILTHPWQKSPVTLRRKLFLKIHNVKIFRLEPIVSSILVGTDLDLLLYHSTHTLERLYICTSCSTLFCDGAATTADHNALVHEELIHGRNTKSSCLDNNNTSSSFPLLHNESEVSKHTTSSTSFGHLTSMITSSSPQHKIQNHSSSPSAFERCCQPEGLWRPGCCYYLNSTITNKHYSFIPSEFYNDKFNNNKKKKKKTLLTLYHLELSGNDAFLWASVLTEWFLPKIISLTLQIWSSDFVDSIEYYNNNIILNTQQHNNNTLLQHHEIPHLLTGVRTAMSPIPYSAAHFRRNEMLRISSSSIPTFPNMQTFIKHQVSTSSLFQEEEEEDCILQDHFSKKTTEEVYNNTSNSLIDSSSSTNNTKDSLLKKNSINNEKFLKKHKDDDNDASSSCCEYIEDEYGNPFWKRSPQCSINRHNILLNFLNHISKTLEELELLVPGDMILASSSNNIQTNHHQVLFKENNQQHSLYKNSNFFDNNSFSSTYNFSASHDRFIPDEQQKAYSLFIKHQFEEFVFLLKYILFKNHFMLKLRRIHFLGIISFTPGVYALLAALRDISFLLCSKSNNNTIQPYKYPHQLFINDLIDFASYVEKGQQPYQPLLPFLPFEYNLDQYLEIGTSYYDHTNKKTRLHDDLVFNIQKINRQLLESRNIKSHRCLYAIRPSTIIKKNNFLSKKKEEENDSFSIHVNNNNMSSLSPTRITEPLSKDSSSSSSCSSSSTSNVVLGWPILTEASFAKCLFVFSGVLHLPEHSCIEITTLFPFIETKIKDDNDIENISSSTSSNYTDPMYTLRIRLEQASQQTKYQREYQRLCHVLQKEREKYLQPTTTYTTIPSSSLSSSSSLNKRKNNRITTTTTTTTLLQNNNKKFIYLAREAPQDCSVALEPFANFITEIAIFLGKSSAVVRQLSFMEFKHLQHLRIVNWSGTNKTHLNLFNLVRCYKPNSFLRLTIETTDQYYSRIRLKHPSNFYNSIMQLIKNLRTCGLLVNQLSLFPGPVSDLLHYIDNFYPISRMHAAAPSPEFWSSFVKNNNIPRYLLTLFLQTPEEHKLDLNNKIIFSSTSYAENKKEPEYSITEFTNVDDGSNDSLTTTPITSLKPPQVMINAKALIDISTPLEYGYSQECQNIIKEPTSCLLKRNLLNFGQQQQQRNYIIPNALLATTTTTTTTEISTVSLDREIMSFNEDAVEVVDRKEKRKIDFPSIGSQEWFTTYLMEALQKFNEGCFFTYNEHENTLLTLSCTLSLSDFYHLILGIRGLAKSHLLSDCFFDEARILLKFDPRDYLLSNEENLTDPIWFMETLIIPWLSITEYFSSLTHGIVILLDVPCKEQRIDKVLDLMAHFDGRGLAITERIIIQKDFNIESHNLQQVRDIIVLLIHPRYWGSQLSQFVLNNCKKNIGDVSLEILASNVRHHKTM